MFMARLRVGKKMSKKCVCARTKSGISNEKRDLFFFGDAHEREQRKRLSCHMKSVGCSSTYRKNTVWLCSITDRQHSESACSTKAFGSPRHA